MGKTLQELKENEAKLLKERTDLNKRINILFSDLNREKDNIIMAVQVFGRKYSNAYVAEAENKIAVLKRKIKYLKDKREITTEQLKAIKALIKAKELEQPKDKGEENK